VCRYGGEEFVVVLRRLRRRCATRVPAGAERVRHDRRRRASACSPELRRDRLRQDDRPRRLDLRGRRRAPGRRPTAEPPGHPGVAASRRRHRPRRRRRSARRR
jgi:GGDEF domain-containing protein